MKKLVILGGGYGGLTVAKELLDGKLPSDTVMILVDRMPYQGLKTEYYALAAGTVSDLEIRVKFPRRSEADSEIRRSAERRSRAEAGEVRRR
ncbi:hypothetical protein LJK88_09850 [Paenibacillus sp. P26]|nr:hypothetical protein LJK88_09850 [Paenibacillus sp. P26]